MYFIISPNDFSWIMYSTFSRDFKKLRNLGPTWNFLDNFEVLVKNEIFQGWSEYLFCRKFSKVPGPTGNFIKNFEARDLMKIGIF